MSERLLPEIVCDLYAHKYRNDEFVLLITGRTFPHWFYIRQWRLLMRGLSAPARYVAKLEKDGLYILMGNLETLMSELRVG